MLGRLARFTVRRRKAILVATGVVFVIAAAGGGAVAEHLTTSGFNDPHAEASRAIAAVEHAFKTRPPSIVLLVSARHGTVDDPEVVAAGTALTRRVAAERGVEQAASYWTLGSVPPLRGHDGKQAMVLVSVGGELDDSAKKVVGHLSARYTGVDGPIVVGVGGQSEVFRQAGIQIREDLATAELIAVPITLVLLVLVFGSVVAAGLPLAVGGFAVIGTFLALRVIASFTSVSIFALNMTTAMGLGLAIDYSLFIVSRYREEMARGLEPHDAVVRTVETAGKTVTFSALTVAVSLAALLVFPLAFLRSFAYAGIAVALIAAVGAVVTLPAILAGLGRNVDRWVLWRRKPKPVGEGVWHRVATTVMRHPIPVATSVILFLLFLGLPFLRITFGLPDDRVLPAGLSSRAVAGQLRHNFSSSESGALSVVATGIGDAGGRQAEVEAYATRLSGLRGVARVDGRVGSYVRGARVQPPGPGAARFVARDATWLSVVPSVEPISPAGEDLVKRIRHEPAPFKVLVGGSSAELLDGKASLFGRMPLALMLIGAATFVLLFLMFGSLLVPAKALVINLLSLTATFGAMVWIFQDGHLSGVLDFTPTGLLDTTTPILMFCIAFGLSMDYEVFLLSRIKEEYDRTRDNTASVAMGLERTGRIVTAAAVLISVVMLATATSGVTFIKLFGIGLALAVLMDAFVIRGTLVPAFMRLAGRANWWAPASLRGLHERFGIGEVVPSAAGLDEPAGEAVGVR